MKSSLEVVVVFKFNDLSDNKADSVIQELTQATKQWQHDYFADEVWVDDAVIYASDNKDTLEPWDEAWSKET
ncbi:hypothetical protein EBT31_12445 [bacterium]|jgi:hypothetical protein|nr:hypothetical protein [bacterium]